MQYRYNTKERLYLFYPQQPLTFYRVLMVEQGGFLYGFCVYIVCTCRYCRNTRASNRSCLLYVYMYDAILYCTCRCTESGHLTNERDLSAEKIIASTKSPRWSYRLEGCIRRRTYVCMYVCVQIDIVYVMCYKKRFRTR